MTDLTAAEQQWHDWIPDACAALDVDPGAVDVTGIHALTKDIAHGFARPMAPVGSYILGLAVGARAAAGRAGRPGGAQRGHALHLPGSRVENTPRASNGTRRVLYSRRGERAGQKVMPRAANLALTSAAAAAPWFARALA